MTLQQEVDESGIGFLADTAVSIAAEAGPSAEEADTLKPVQSQSVLRADGHRTAIQTAETKLFGGAQYHRLVREFAEAVKMLPAVAIPPEEVINSMGIAAGSDALHVGRPILSLPALTSVADHYRPCFR